jgi:hypothetical protein
VDGIKKEKESYAKGKVIVREIMEARIPGLKSESGISMSICSAM